MFDIDTELDLLRRQTSEIRKKKYSRSRLDRYRGELTLSDATRDRRTPGLAVTLRLRDAEPRRAVKERAAEPAGRPPGS